MHDLYDGGHGAGLEDYWLLMWSDPLCAGGFLWNLADEAIERRGLNDSLDTDGNHGADGILVPSHKKEVSFYTIVLSTNTYTLEGYVFLGWSTTPTGAVEYADGALFTIGSTDVTLYAVWGMATGIENVSNSITISIHPNPATNDVTVSFDKEVNGEILIYGIAGQVVRYIPLRSEACISINVSDLNKGLYIIKINANTDRFNKRLIIR